MHSIVILGANLLIGVGALAANYYFWGLIWDWLVGPIPPSRFPMMGK